jgi:hypothetical protein
LPITNRTLMNSTANHLECILWFHQGCWCRLRTTISDSRASTFAWLDLSGTSAWKMQLSSPVHVLKYLVARWTTDLSTAVRHMSRASGQLQLQKLYYSFWT